MNSYQELIDRYKTLQDSFANNIKQDEIEHYKAMTSLMAEINIPTEKLYKLRLEEYRDDRVHCFQVAQEGLVLVKGFNPVIFGNTTFIKPECELVKFTPSGKIKYKNGKIDTKRIFNNWLLTWKLIDENDNIILSYEPEQYIIPGTYTDEKLKEISKIVFKIQKFK